MGAPIYSPRQTPSEHLLHHLQPCEKPRWISNPIKSSEDCSLAKPAQKKNLEQNKVVVLSH